MAEEDILTAAASGTQSMLPQMAGNTGGNTSGANLTQFGPAPLIAPPPLPQYQPRQQEQVPFQSSFPSVGARKRYDQHQTLSSAASIIKSGVDYVNQKKQRALSMDISRILEAQQGLVEAKQLLQQDPNNAQAKEGMQKNVSIINDITGDPKKLKQLQKAFNVDLFGSGKNQKENQALAQAWKEFNQKKQEGDKTALNPAAQRLQAQQPYRQQLSPEAQQQAQAIQAGLIPKAAEILKSNVEMYKAISSAKTAEERNASIEKAAELRAQAERYHADKIVDAANVRSLGQSVAQEIATRARVKIAQMTADTWDKRLSVMKNIAAGKNANPFFKQLSQQATTYTTEMARLIQETKAAQVELDKKGTSIFGIKFGAATDADSKLLRQKIAINNFRMKDIENSLNSVQNQMGVLNKFGVNVGMGGSGQDGDLGTKDQPIDVDDDTEQ